MDSCEVAGLACYSCIYRPHRDSRTQQRKSYPRNSWFRKQFPDIRIAYYCANRSSYFCLLQEMRKTEVAVGMEKINPKNTLYPYITSMSISSEILNYESALTEWERMISETLRNEIETTLPEATSKVWHGHPVWFLEDNPIVWYSKLKDSVQLLFWSGQSFDEVWLTNIGNFQAAEKRYSSLEQVDIIELARWLTKSRDIQWDYANIVKQKWKLERLK